MEIPAQSPITDVTHIVDISSNIQLGACPECGAAFTLNDEYFTSTVNHYLERHDFILLHVGSYSSRDHEGNAWQNLVAVLGK